jgi:hypothetical protein
VLTISNLKKGLYKLKLFDSNQSINIIVLEGNYWNNTSMIVTKDEMIDMKKNN